MEPMTPEAIDAEVEKAVERFMAKKVGKEVRPATPDPASRPKR
jgi:hypothetical protein